MSSKETRDVFVLVFSHSISYCDQIYNDGYNVLYAGTPKELDTIMNHVTGSPNDLILGNLAEVDDRFSDNLSKSLRDLAEVMFSPDYPKEYGPTKLTEKKFTASGNERLCIVYDNGMRYINEVLFNLPKNVNNVQYFTRSMSGMFVNCARSTASMNFSDLVE